MSSDARLQWGWKSVKAAEPQTASSEPLQAPGPARPTGTFIESGALFEGTLSLRGDFRIDSEFRGELTTDGTIIVGPRGSIVGDIRAREVEIFGAVVGNVSARRQLVLHAESRLHGDIDTACLEIEKHAFFQGSTSMTEPQAYHRPKTSPQPAASSLPAPAV
jgi:cytoskeletal protein CcmA (bactofilin family)